MDNSHVFAPGYYGVGTAGGIQPDKVTGLKINTKQIGKGSLTVDHKGRLDGFWLKDLSGIQNIAGHIAGFAEAFCEWNAGKHIIAKDQIPYLRSFCHELIQINVKIFRSFYLLNLNAFLGHL